MLKKEKLFELLEKDGILEIEIREGQQITIFKKEDIYKIYLEHWNDEIEDWEAIFEFQEQKDFYDLIGKLKTLIGIDIE